MECNQETLQFLSQSILQTLYPIPEARRAAERSLLETAEKSNYGLAFLRLVAELSVDEQTSRQAAASINFTDVQSFIENIITPELQSPDVNSDPTLKAGSLKFLTMFRSQLPKPFAMQMFPELVSLLKAESNAVRSYSASCIEKLLLVKDEGGRRRYVGSDISPFLLQLMTNLFDALEIPGSEEDQYVMKCVMRVLGVAEITWEEVAEPCLEGLTPLLREACQKNPKNSVFYHYLFESVAALVRRACERDDLLIVAFDLSLFPILLTILTNDVQELVPYSLQLLAQLVELSAPPISPDFMNIFVLILSVPSPWNTRRDVPGLVRLLQAFLRKSPHELTQGNRLSQALGVFEKLVKSPSTYEQGCQVLCTVLENTEYEYGAIAPYTTSVWSSLFTRLQEKTTPEFLKSLVIVMSLFVAKHGPANLVDTMNAVQPNIFVTILNRFWIPNLTLVTGTLEVKLAAVAATRLVCETPALLVPIVSRLWGTMVNSIVTLFTRPDEETRAVDDDDEPENVGYTADAFVNLCNVGRREVDPVEEISDPKEFLVTSLATLSAAHPGRLPLVIRYNLDKVNQDALILLCAAYNCVIV